MGLTGSSTLSRKAAVCLFLAALYFTGAKLGLPFSLAHNTGATPLWPPAGIALAGLVLLGWRAFPGVWIGSFAAYLGFLHAREGLGWAAGVKLASVLASGDAAEALAGWWLCVHWLIPRWLGPDGRLSAQCMSVAEFAGVTLVAAFVGSAVSPAAVCAALGTPWREFPLVWLTGFAGDATSILIITPFLLSFFVEDRPAGRGDWREAASALAAVASLTAAAFGAWVHVGGQRVPLSFFITGPIVWIALRLGLRTMVQALVALATIAAWYTAHHEGMFARFGENVSFLLLNMYLWVSALSSLALAFEVAARLEAQTALNALNAHLEDMVHARTDRLRSAFDTIRVNERRFSAFMDNLPGVAFMKDAAGRYVYINDKVTEILDLPTDRWVGRTDTELFPAPAAAKLRADDARVLETGLPIKILEDLPQADGGSRSWLTHKFALPDDDGRPRLLAGVAIDVTDRRRVEEALAARVRQQTAVAELGLRALHGGEPSSLLRAAVGQIAATLGVELCGVFELLPDDDALVLRAATGWPEGNEGRLTVPLDESTEAGYAALHREALIVPDLASEKRFRRATEALARGAVSAASVVIFGLGERPYGVLCAHSTRRHQFSPDDIAFLQAAANVLAMAVHRQTLENEVQQSSDNERARIAYDLHDGLGQELAGVSYMASVLAANLAGSSGSHADDAAKVAALLRDSVKHARTIVRGLCPIKIEDGGLPAALTELARSTEEQTGIRCRFEHDERARVDDPFVAGHLFRIAQECVHNAVKHSGAKEIAARLVAHERSVALIVEDDGVGLDNDRRDGGLGLRIMKHRAAIINASLSVNGGAGGGTRVTCRTSLN